MSKITVKSVLLGGLSTASASTIAEALRGSNQREFELILMSLEWSEKLHKVMKIVSESDGWGEKRIERLHSRFCRLRYRHEQELLAKGKWY